METVTFVVTFVVSAAVIAAWVDARAPRLAPRTINSAVLRLAALFFTSMVLSRPAGDAVIGTGIPGARVVAIVGIILPALAGVILGVIWLTRAVQGQLRGSHP